MTFINRLIATFAVVLFAFVLFAPAVAAQTTPPVDVGDYGAVRLAPGPVGDSALRAASQAASQVRFQRGRGPGTYAASGLLFGVGAWLWNDIRNHSEYTEEGEQARDLLFVSGLTVITVGIIVLASPSVTHHPAVTLHPTGASVSW